VIDRADVGLVDAHSKRDRRDHNTVVRRHETILHGLAHFSVHAGMIRLDREAGFRQRSRDCLRGFLERHINNRGAGGPRFQPCDQNAQPVARGARGRSQMEIGAIKPGVHMSFGHDLEFATNVFRDRRSRRGRQGEHSADLELPRITRELEVIGAKIMSPLGDAVRLVDHE
jgi:hypothetical protein